MGRGANNLLYNRIKPNPQVSLFSEQLSEVVKQTDNLDYKKILAGKKTFTGYQNNLKAGSSSFANDNETILDLAQAKLYSGNENIIFKLNDIPDWMLSSSCSIDNIYQSTRFNQARKLLSYLISSSQELSERSQPVEFKVHYHHESGLGDKIAAVSPYAKLVAYTESAKLIAVEKMFLTEGQGEWKIYFEEHANIGFLATYWDNKELKACLQLDNSSI
jgi:hypothetical protein